jgi:hypothetical protein
MQEKRATLPRAKKGEKKGKKKGRSKRLEAAITFVERLGPCSNKKLLRHKNNCPHH